MTSSGDFRPGGIVGWGARQERRPAVAETATGRFTQPHEIAELVLLLASDRAGNIAGADFVLDGGLIATL